MKTKFNCSDKFLEIDNIITYNYIFLPASLFILIYILVIYTFRIFVPSSSMLFLFGYLAIFLLYALIVKYWFGYLNLIKEEWGNSITINYKHIKKGYDVINVDKLLSFQVIPYIEYKNKYISKVTLNLDNPLTEYNYVLIATAININKTILITRGSYSNCAKAFDKIMYEFNKHSKTPKSNKMIEQINENSTLLEVKVIQKYRIMFLKVILGVILLELLRAL